MRAEDLALLLALASAVGILVVATMLALVTARLASVRLRSRPTLLPLLTGMLVAALLWLTGLTRIPSTFAAPVIALGGLFAIVATLRHRETERPLVTTAVFTALVTATVFTPLITVMFALWYDPLATGIGYLDLGGALPTEIAAGVIVLVVSLLDRRSSVTVNRGIGHSSLVWPTLLLVAGWAVWLVGLELAIDRLTPQILADALVMPASGALAWAIVERVRYRANTVAGTVCGILAGCAAATSAAGYLIPQLAIVIGLVAGAVCALLPRGRRAVNVAAILAVGGGVGIVLLGLLAQNVSFIYTGQPEVVFSQLLTVALGAIIAALFGAALWAGLRLVRR